MRQALGTVKSAPARGLIVLFITLALIVGSFARPVLAQTVTTTTSSLVNRFGNTVTTTDTFVDGVLVSRDSQEVMPDGTVTLVKHWDFYADGTVKNYTEQRVNGFAPYKIERQYDASGVLRFQYAELYINGELALQSFLTFDAQGFLVTKEERVLTTLADGTKVWMVTYETWSADVLVSSQVVQYPFGYDFNAGSNTGDPANVRPGWGYGDENHKHSGPPGREERDSSSSGSGSSGSVNDDETRPGRGMGDENHEHSGAPGQNN